MAQKKGNACTLSGKVGGGIVTYIITSSILIESVTPSDNTVLPATMIRYSIQYFLLQ